MNSKYTLHSTLLIILAVVLVANLYFSSSMNWHISSKTQEQLEAAKPAELEVVLITDSACADCTDLSTELISLKQKSTIKIVDEKTVERSSPEGQDLIATHGILRVPALVVSGEIEKSGTLGMRKVDNVLIKDDTALPYVNPFTGETRGKVSVIAFVDKTCTKCSKLDDIIGSLTDAGMQIAEQKEVDVASAEGKQLAATYKLLYAPVLLMKGDFAAYEDLQEALTQAGTFETDGMYVLRSATPPYRNLSTKRVEGIVSLTYLTDDTCTQCYDPKLHKEILSRLGMAFGEEKYVDVSSEEGQQYMEQYKFTSLPTVILSADASAYQLFDQIWQQVGTKESDGLFVFRRNDALQETYKDLESGEIVEKTAAAQE